MENVQEVKRKCKRKESGFGKRYGFELKLRCVKLRLEEGLSVALISKEVGVGRDGIHRWVKAYRERGEAGLRNRVRSSGSRQKLPGAVRKKIYRHQEARAILWSPADIPSIKASVLPERLTGDGAADVTGRVFDCSLPEETFSEHNQASIF
jgi:transposase-like protein